MRLSFRSVAVASAGLFFFLTAIWIFAPDRMFGPWGVAPSDAGYFMAHRAAATFFGMGVLAALARDLAPSPARDAITYGIVAAFLAVAAAGAYEFASGHAGSGIFSAVAVELAFAAAFVAANRR